MYEDRGLLNVQSPDWFAPAVATSLVRRGPIEGISVNGGPGNQILNNADASKTIKAGTVLYNMSPDFTVRPEIPGRSFYGSSPIVAFVGSKRMKTPAEFLASKLNVVTLKRDVTFRRLRIVRNRGPGLATGSGQGGEDYFVGIWGFPELHSPMDPKQVELAIGGLPQDSFEVDAFTLEDVFFTDLKLEPVHILVLKWILATQKPNKLAYFLSLVGKRASLLFSKLSLSDQKTCLMIEANQMRNNRNFPSVRGTIFLHEALIDSMPNPRGFRRLLVNICPRLATHGWTAPARDIDGEKVEALNLDAFRMFSVYANTVIELNPTLCTAEWFRDQPDVSKLFLNAGPKHFREWLYEEIVLDLSLVKTLTPAAITHIVQTILGASQLQLKVADALRSQWEEEFERANSVLLTEPTSDLLKQLKEGKFYIAGSSDTPVEYIAKAEIRGMPVNDLVWKNVLHEQTLDGKLPLSIFELDIVHRTKLILRKIVPYLAELAESSEFRWYTQDEVNYAVKVGRYEKELAPFAAIKDHLFALFLELGQEEEEIEYIFNRAFK
jgi:hypothetical protein